MTAIASKLQVDPGEQFVRGRMLSEGKPVGGAPVRAPTWSDDRLVNFTGARLWTNSEGRYRVRIVPDHKATDQSKGNTVSRPGVGVRR